MTISSGDPESERSTDAYDETLVARIAQQLPDAVIVLGGDACVRWGNTAAERLFGRTLNASIGVSALEFIHSDDIELVLRSLTSVREKDVGTLIEIRVATPNGWTMVEVIGKHAPELGPENLLFVLRDITERRRFEVARDDVAKFRSIIQNTSFVTMLVTSDRVVEAASAAMTRTFGHDPEQIERRSVFELFTAEDRAPLERAFTDAPTVGEVTLELECVRHDGGVMRVEVVIASLLDDPTIGGFVLSMRNVSDLSQTQRELRVALSLLEATLESTADGILVVDLSGSIVSYNRRFAELWEIPDEMLVGRESDAAVQHVRGQLVDASQFDAVRVGLSADPSSENLDTFELVSGKVIERYTRPQRVGHEIVGRVSSFRDVTERRRLEASLAHRAYHDSLTGLANKELFLEQLEQAASRGDVAVLFIDVDGLKAVNDRFGHDAGDQLLQDVADVLRAGAGETCTVARLGGDEFAIIARSNVERVNAEALADSIIDGLPRKFSLGGDQIDVSVSIGISIGTSGTPHLDLLRRADAAMYVAKGDGGGRWAFATSDQ